MNNGLKIFSGVVIVLVVMQFISSTDNGGNAYGPDDITHAVPVPDSVKHILETSCYDCHSNHTNYMWYSHVQPVGLWIGHHISDGKEELNFSEYNKYSAKRKVKKILNIEKQLKEDKMPINSYLRMHPDAQLSEARKKILLNWADSSYALVSAANH